MGAPKNYNDFPEPDNSTSAQVNGGPSSFNVRKIGDLWRPKGINFEPLIATLARVALRLVDRETGISYSADELEAKILQSGVSLPPLAITAPPVSGELLPVMTITGDVSYNSVLPLIGIYQGSPVYSNNPANLSDPTSPVANSKTIYRPSGSPWQIWYNNGGSPAVTGQTIETLLPAGTVASPELVASWNLTSLTISKSTTTITGTVATSIGKLAIVTTTNASGTFRDVWTATAITPFTLWRPPGYIKKDRTNGLLYREFYSGGRPATELAYP